MFPLYLAFGIISVHSYPHLASIRVHDQSSQLISNLNCLNAFVPQNANSINKNTISRFARLISFGYFSIPNVAHSAKGAFELDAEFYFNALIGKQKDEKIIKDSIPVYESPRSIDYQFASKVLECVDDAICDCANVTTFYIQSTVGNSISYALNYFKLFAPISKDDLSDQYYFDMVLYLHYLEAGKLLPKSESRVELRKVVGDKILALIRKTYQTPPIITQSKTVSRFAQAVYGSKNIVALASGVKNILQIYNDTGFVSGYILDDEDFADESYALNTFAEGLALAFQVTIKSPVTLLGVIQSFKQDTFYHPEIFGTVISSYAKELGYAASFEDYLVDNYYRTSNFDIQAQDILLEFRITMAP